MAVEITKPEEVEAIKKKKKRTPSQNLELAYAGMKGDTHEEEKLLRGMESEGIDRPQRTLSLEEEKQAMELPRDTAPKQTNIITGEPSLLGAIGTSMNTLEEQTLFGKIQRGTIGELPAEAKGAATLLGAGIASIGGSVLMGGLTAVGTSLKIPVLSKLSQYGGGVLTGVGVTEFKNFLTGKDSENLAEKYDKGIKDTIEAVKVGAKDTYQAQRELDEYISQLNQLEGSFHTGLRKYTAKTESGRKFIESIKSAIKTQEVAQVELNNFIAEQQQLRRQALAFTPR